MKRLLIMGLLGFCAILTWAQSGLPRNFRIEINRMYPQRFPSRQVMDFHLEINEDTADVCLPYVGEVYVPTFNREGLNFRAPMHNVERLRDSKGVERITFSIKREEVTYQFILQAYPNGDVELRLRPSNAQPCGYLGELVTESPEKVKKEKRKRRG